MTSPLIPWNSCGAYMAATLGVATTSYVPFAFFNLLNPLVSIAFAFLGLRMLRTADGRDPSRPAARPTTPEAKEHPHVPGRFDPRSSPPPPRSSRSPPAHPPSASR